jgi:hypothetical protein
MDASSIFFTLLAIWYFNKNGMTSNLLTLISWIHNKFTRDHNVPELINEIVETPHPEPAVEMKYEDKYLAHIRKLDRDFKFDETDPVMVNKINECITTITASFANRRKEIAQRLHIISTEIDEDIQQLKKALLEEDDALRNSLETEEGKAQTNTQAVEDARQFMIDSKMDKLKNCHVMEHTPVGNVLMIYDKDRETFKYYSDNSIPYRYLEVVARKYVKLFNCRPIFVNTEDEILLAEQKRDQLKKEKEEKEAVEKKRKEDALAAHKPTEEKKRIFAKFKSYNKEAGTGHVSMGAPPKNSVPNRQPAEKSENEAVLKERANRYTYEGKMVNFSFIKKVDRKVVDKKLAMSFADFKKMNSVLK